MDTCSFRFWQRKRHGAQHNRGVERARTPGNIRGEADRIRHCNQPGGIGSSLVQNGGLPIQAYYSAWYYLPQSVTVGVYWVIMKFRAALGDPPTQGELFDVNLTSPSAGVMSLRLTTIEMATCRCWMHLRMHLRHRGPVNAWFNSRLSTGMPTTPPAI